MVSYKKQKKLLKLAERRQAMKRQQPASETKPAADADKTERPPFEILRTLCVDSLMHIDSMMCQSNSIAQERYATDATHLLKILSNQHLGVERLLQQLGVECRRSTSGTLFNPELMEADATTVPTMDEEKDGCVADTVTPGFFHEGAPLACEVVKLYQYIKED